MPSRSDVVGNGSPRTYQKQNQHRKRFDDPESLRQGGSGRVDVSHLGERKLTAEEQANVLDFPVDRTVKMTGEELLALTRKEIPGKVLTAASWFLKHWNTTIGNDEQMNKAQSSLEERVQPDIKSNHNKTDQSYLDLCLEAKLLRFQEERLNDVVKDDYAAASVHLWNNRIAIGLNRMRRERKGDCGRQCINQPYFDFDEDDGITRYSKFLGTFLKLLQPVMLK
jgi:hypothetical protein